MTDTIEQLARLMSEVRIDDGQPKQPDESVHGFAERRKRHHRYLKFVELLTAFHAGCVADTRRRRLE